MKLFPVINFQPIEHLVNITINTSKAVVGMNRRQIYAVMPL